MIWGAEFDSVVKTALAVALGGPIGKTLEKCEKFEKWQNRHFSTSVCPRGIKMCI